MGHRVGTRGRCPPGLAGHDLRSARVDPGAELEPDQYAKLRANPDLIPSMVSETIRWQTPLAHMRRTANEDVEFGGKTIKKGDKVVVVRLGQPRRDEVIDRPNDYIIDRERPGSTSRSGSASTAAWATAWPSCSSPSSGKRS